MKYNYRDMRKKVIIFVLVAAAGFGLGFLTPKRWLSSASIFTGVYAVRPPDATSEYKFINPLLLYDFSEQSEFFEYRDMKDSLTGLIEKETKAGGAETVSVYFRDLKTGHWVGINQNADYAPASLLKVPVMIAFFKQAEIEPNVLERKIAYEVSGPSTSDLEQSKLKPGNIYTVAQLVEEMIINSDNVAKELLVQLVDKNSLDEVFTDLGVQISPGGANPYAVSTKTYSMFFRILRNATFLNRDLSEKALDILSRTTFNDGLAAGLPANTTVAHKYGFHNLDGGKMQLHDCGIIYVQPDPYLLCVMTQGRNAADLQTVIKDISALVFKNIKS